MEQSPVTLYFSGDRALALGRTQSCSRFEDAVQAVQLHALTIIAISLVLPNGVVPWPLLAELFTADQVQRCHVKGHDGVHRRELWSILNSSFLPCLEEMCLENVSPDLNSSAFEAVQTIRLRDCPGVLCPSALLAAAARWTSLEVLVLHAMLSDQEVLPHQSHTVRMDNLQELDVKDRPDQLLRILAHLCLPSLRKAKITSDCAGLDLAGHEHVYSRTLPSSFTQSFDVTSVDVRPSRHGILTTGKVGPHTVVEFEAVADPALPNALDELFRGAIGHLNLLFVSSLDTREITITGPLDIPDVLGWQVMLRSFPGLRTLRLQDPIDSASESLGVNVAEALASSIEQVSGPPTPVCEELELLCFNGKRIPIPRPSGIA